MQTEEMYYLVLVCGAFATIMGTLALGSLMERRWVRQQERKAAAAHR